LHALSCLGNTLEREPTLVSQLVHMALGSMAREEIRRWMPRVEFSDQDLARFQADLRRSNYARSLNWSLMGERLIGKEGFQGMPLWQVTRGDDYVEYLRTISRIQPSLEQPWPAPLKEMQQIENDLAPHANSGLGRTKYALTIQFLPSLRSSVEAAARYTALDAAADAAIGVERFRRANGRLPERLEELVPQFLPRLPLDPYSGGNQRVLLKPDSIVIYSVGIDGVDNGGVGDDRGKPDVVFELKFGK
jgi:hypothetical protein